MNQEQHVEIQRKLNKAKAKLEEAKKRVDDAGGPIKFSFHGGWDVGYFAGRVSALEDAIDVIENTQS